MERAWPSRRAAILGAVVAALAGCGRSGTVEYPELTLVTGPPGAVFREVGAALAAELSGPMPGTEITVLDTGASAENLRLLESGRAHVGFSSLDAALAGGEAGPEGLLALCRLYDSYLHLVVPAASAAAEFGNIAGLRVSLGARDSGTEFTGRRLLELTGVEVDDVLLDQADSAAALGEEEIDAMFSLTGIPTPAITGLAAEQRLRCLELDEQADELAETYPGSYYPATIPATAYDGIPACRTLSVPNILLARADLPEDVAEAITRTVFTRASEIAAERPEAAQLNVRTGIATGPIPLHPGAERWFRAQKS
ncbi:TAXI family TRAP transporter solute-binding subunit [Allosalinactinospora lopnorensis]|uniref:TAXI family TRAP transporter solute-binding subunit n=1 Tax=Allosalinactinospora lopnorensis TaxID=1352348 RepID=UPI000623EAB0|nr:TAXI family TRAP transporter solute-binding subunit [Allosalinactinospora lopnorensis]